MDLSPGSEPIRVVVEVVSNADVRRLESEDADLRAEITRLERRIEGLNRTIYELLESIGRLRSKR